ncbi:MAG: SBBP repeat-containing protein [Phycisphaerales bacterium]|nr:SBBP repeat-containing protein [Phycisphaerales bacterium]
MRHACTRGLGLALVSSLALAAGALGFQSPAAQRLNLGLRGVYFVPNEGQWSDAGVIYGYRARGLDIAFRESSFTMHLARQISDAAPTTSRGKGSAPPRIDNISGERLLLADDEIRGDEDSAPAWEHLTLAVTFPGSNEVQPVAAQPQGAKFNYFVGDDESKWASNVPSFGEVVYRNLYDGVDLHITGAGARGFASESDADGVLKYEFHVAPGADWSQIRIQYDGIESLCIDEPGNLHIATTFGTLTDAAPLVWQPRSPGRDKGSAPSRISPSNDDSTIPARFELVNNTTYTITLDATVDPTQELIIDPDVEWSRYLGGESVDEGRGVAARSDGSVVAVGSTGSEIFEGQNNSNHGDWDAFVVSADGDGRLLWMTFIGGSGHDAGFGASLEPGGAILLSGETQSADFAQRNNELHGISDAFLARLDDAGSLLRMTYVGGSNAESTYSQPGIDRHGYIVIAGVTESPDIEGRLNDLHPGSWDSFICQLSPSLETQWALYLGGTGGDSIFEMTLDGEGSALATGVTGSVDFDGRINSYHGDGDPFVVKVDPEGQLLWMTYLGGSGYGDEDGNGIAVESDGTIVVCGTTESDDLEGATNSRLGYQDIYIARLKPNGTVIRSTYIGGSQGDYGYFLALDAQGNALITGETNSDDFIGRRNGLQSGFAILASINRLDAVNWMIYCGGSQGWGTAVAAGPDAAYVVGGVRVSDLEGRLNAYGGNDDGFLLKYGPLTVPDLSVDSSCPDAGPIQLTWFNATPSAPAALLFARNSGSFSIPNNRPCPGTMLGLGAEQLQVAFTGNSDANGSRTLNATIGPNLCGGYLQLLDLTTCTTSNVARIE